MLHIHNGDSSAGTLKMSDVAGEHLPFRENLMAGPTPEGLTPADWLSIRARFLADDDGPDEEKCGKDLTDQEEALIIISVLDDWRQVSRSNRFIKSSFALTETGAEVLAGGRDFIEVNSIDLWLGGAHLTADNLWRWDEQKRKLIRA